MSVSDELGRRLKESLGISPYPYQEKVIEDILKSMEKVRFLVVSMPTGSGKTIVELMTAEHLRRKKVQSSGPGAYQTPV